MTKRKATQSPRKQKKKKVATLTDLPVQLKQEFDSELVQLLRNEVLSPTSDIATTLACAGFLSYVMPQYESADVVLVTATINEHHRHGTPDWTWTSTLPFETVFNDAADSLIDDETGIAQKYVIAEFLVNCYKSLDVSEIRKCCLRFVWLPLLASVRNARRLDEFQRAPELKEHWEASRKSSSKAEKSMIPALLVDLFTGLDEIEKSDTCDELQLSYLLMILQLIVGLLGQLAPRRFLVSLLRSCLLVERIFSSPFAKTPKGAQLRLFAQQISDSLALLVDEHSGEAESQGVAKSLQFDRLGELQQRAFSVGDGMADFAFAGYDQFHSISDMRTAIAKLDEKTQLKPLCDALRIRNVQACTKKNKRTGFPKSVNQLLDLSESHADNSAVLVEAVALKYGPRPTVLEELNQASLFPEETDIWEDSSLSTGVAPFNADDCNPPEASRLPRTNVQYLSLNDYLVRHFVGNQVQSATFARELLDGVVPKLCAGEPSGCGKKVDAFKVTHVGPLGHEDGVPSSVKAEVHVMLNDKDTTSGWTGLSKLDTLLFLAMQTKTTNQETDLARQIAFVRGGHVVDVLDASREPLQRGKRTSGNRRILSVEFDRSAYKRDMDMVATREIPNPYEAFDYVVRVPADDSRWGALRSLRECVNRESAGRLGIPEWLEDIIVGYGSPDAGSYESLETGSTTQTLRFNGTFVNLQHLKSCFAGAKMTVAQDAAPPFQVELVRGDDPSEANGLRTKQIGRINVTRSQVPGHLAAPRIPLTGPQMQALLCAMDPGLTLVNGGKGSGKTEVCKALVENLLANYPRERVLVVGRTRDTLGRFFHKMAAEVPHVNLDMLLMLPHGQVSGEFGVKNRVDAILARRLVLLGQVDVLAKHMNNTSAVGSTCENARNFFESGVKLAYEEYCTRVAQEEDIRTILESFPFTSYYGDALRSQVAACKNAQAAKAVLKSFFESLTGIFVELEKYHPFELLVTFAQRKQYLCNKHASVVGLTCGDVDKLHSEFVEQGMFQYDTVIVQQACQMTEVETLLCLTMQKKSYMGATRLKRVVLVGDDCGLPTSVKAPMFQAHTNMHQSMFHRLVRFGVPVVRLGPPIIGRPSLVALTHGDAANTVDVPANAGMGFDFQFVDVGEYEGKGEMEPKNKFFQNLGEAEYVVAVFRYMRLIGYLAENITILTSYQGQKHLIMDVLMSDPTLQHFYGTPKVTTIDRYQDNRSEIVLVSLVRTNECGVLGDVRRWRSMLSSATNGLYVFGRKSMVEKSEQVVKLMKPLLDRPSKLQLVLGEPHPTSRMGNATSSTVHTVDQVTDMMVLVQQLANMAMGK